VASHQWLATSGVVTFKLNSRINLVGFIPQSKSPDYTNILVFFLPTNHNALKPHTSRDLAHIST
jgi:hypothetical protein